MIARNLDTGAIVASRVEVAATREQRRTGLLKHAGLGPGEALWIVPCRGVDELTVAMLDPNDIIALDEGGRVIDRVSRLRPWRIRFPRRGTAGVLELAEGALDASGVELGHRIEFQDEKGDRHR